MSESINMNDTVKVRLSARGLEILRRNHENELGALAERYPFKAPDVDADGWSVFQLWVLMREFGAHLYNGVRMPFDAEILIPPKKG